MSTHLDMELAGSFIRGELGEREAARWSEHISTCPNCQKLVEEERAMQSLLRLDGGAVGDAAVERAVAQLGATFERDRRRKWLRKIVLMTAGAGAAALLLAWGVYVWQGPDEAQLSAERLGINPAMQRRIIDNLARLETLRRQPWLNDDFETVVAMQRQLEAAEVRQP